MLRDKEGAVLSALEVLQRAQSRNREWARQLARVVTGGLYAITAALVLAGGVALVIGRAGLDRGGP